MAKTKRTKAKRKTTPRPSKEALAAADAMLAVPTALGLLAVEVEKMVQQTRQMELAVRALVLELKPELVSKLPPLTEPSPPPAAELLMEFKHEPKDYP